MSGEYEFYMNLTQENTDAMNRRMAAVKQTVAHQDRVMDKLDKRQDALHQMLMNRYRVLVMFMEEVVRVVVVLLLVVQLMLTGAVAAHSTPLGWRVVYGLVLAASLWVNWKLVELAEELRSERGTED